MNTFDKLKTAYQENWINKEDIYNQVVNGKILSEDYKLITGEECEISLDVIKLQRIKELDISCNEDIQNGFYSTVNDVEYLWGFDEKTDQPNLNQMLSATGAGIATNEFYWKPKGELTPILVTIDQFKQMCIDAQTSKIMKIGKFWTLKAQILQSEAKEEIQAIVW